MSGISLVPAMEPYRAYLIGRDGHFQKVVEIVAENDETQASVRGNLSAATTRNYGKEAGGLRCSSAIRGNSRSQVELFRPPLVLCQGARPWINSKAKNRNWNAGSNGAAGWRGSFRMGSPGRTFEILPLN